MDALLILQLDKAKGNVSPSPFTQRLFSFKCLLLLTLSLKIMLLPHLFWDLFIVQLFPMDFFITLTLVFAL